MNKRMRELQALIIQETDAAKSCTVGENKDISKAQEHLAKAKEYQAELDTLAELDKINKGQVPMDPVPNPEKPNAIKAFADAARAHFKGMNETTGADGGYTVPEDINTMVNNLREQHFSLASLIDHETVNTNSGRRTYKQRSQATGFSQVGEGAKIGQAGGPKFSVINYDIKKYAGYMPVTNELLEDSDAAIASMMTEWLAKESVATENAQILAKVNAKAATAMKSVDDIKKAVNVDLAAFAGTVRIVTNADGLQYFDTLIDGTGRYLLSPDPANPMGMFLCVGVRRIPITVVPNEVLATSAAGAIPMIVGDLHEYMKQFDRKQLTLMTSNVAAVTDFNAFEQDMTLVRAIMRADWVVKDGAAIVRGELTPAAE